MSARRFLLFRSVGECGKKYTLLPSISGGPSDIRAEVLRLDHELDKIPQARLTPIVFPQEFSSIQGSRGVLNCTAQPTAPSAIPFFEAIFRQERA